MSEEYIDIQVFDGDEGIKYIKYEDMINLIEKIKIKQDEKDKEIQWYEKENRHNQEIIIKDIKEKERLNNIINKAIEYINKNWGHWCSNHCKYATETINILKGVDKE